MNKLFKEHYNSSDEEFKQLWSSGLIILDTNILLNFYRYSDSTINDFTNVLNKLRERLWLPFQVASEFHKDRLDVIIQQIKVYREAILSIRSLEGEFLNKNRNPFLSEGLLVDFSNVLRSASSEMETKCQKYEDRLTNDDIMMKVSSIFDGRVGNMYSQEKTKEIETLGLKRYNDKIPPGYEDKNKSNNKYGDLIIWMQIIDKAKEVKKPVIFITDDTKDDWWLIRNGKKISARPELKKEFYDNVDQLFHLYRPFVFLEHADEQLKMDIERKTIDEVKDLESIRIEGNSNEIDKDLLITITLEKASDNINLDRLLNNFRVSGYDVHWEALEGLMYKIFIPVPNIPDLPRRIKTKFIHDLDKYGLKLIDFKPEISI